MSFYNTSRGRRRVRHRKEQAKAVGGVSSPKKRNVVTVH
jgi:hypothetical protein